MIFTWYLSWDLLIVLLVFVTSGYHNNIVLIEHEIFDSKKKTTKVALLKL